MRPTKSMIVEMAKGKARESHAKSAMNLPNIQDPTQALIDITSECEQAIKLLEDYPYSDQDRDLFVITWTLYRLTAPRH